MCSTSNFAPSAANRPGNNNCWPSPCPAPGALQRLLGLTRAEALLVQALFAGRSLSAAAVTLRISRETAKTQLSCIFHKCRVKSQAQLTRLVAGGPFFSEPADGTQPGLS